MDFVKHPIRSLVRVWNFCRDAYAFLVKLDAAFNEAAQGPAPVEAQPAQPAAPTLTA